MNPIEKAENSSHRPYLESATLPDGSEIKVKGRPHIQRIIKILIEAREQSQPFSLQQIMDTIDQSPENLGRRKNRTEARQTALSYIERIRAAMRSNCNHWVIDAITSRKDTEE